MRALVEKKWQGAGIQYSKKPGMLDEGEARMLYVLARDHYLGKGEIIDAGALVGASAHALASGLRDNPFPGDKTARIHSYDRFAVGEAIQSFLRQRLGIERKIGDHFDDLYRNHLAELGHHVQIHKGDLLKETWSGRPIEILFIDVAKNPALNSQVIKSFFPSLIEQHSVVVHQDYHFPMLPFIHVTMEFLSPYFTVVDEKIDSSLVWVCEAAVPETILQKVIAYGFSREEQLDLMCRAIERLRFQNRAHVELARVVLVRNLDSQEAALAALAEVEEKYAVLNLAADRHWVRNRTMLASAWAQMNPTRGSSPAI